MSEASKSPTNSPPSPIVVPPFPSNEDISEVEQFQAPPKSDNGIGARLSELSDIQKIVDGSKPKPSEVGSKAIHAALAASSHQRRKS